MRINVYSQELTSDIEMVMKEADTPVFNEKITYSAVRLFLHSSDKLHQTQFDDDRSAVTFWLPKSKERREEFALTLERLAQKVRYAKPETGLD